MHVNIEDITVPWGRAPDPRDIQMGRWRMAVFQDVQESIDHSKLYFLYDPIADENSGTTGGRKGDQGLVVFDLYQRCFTREIPIFCEGTPKFIFALKCPSSSGGSSFIIVCTGNRYGQTELMLSRIDLTLDGMNLESEPKALISNFIPASDTYIVSMREDVPEIVLMTSPGLTVWRISCTAGQPSSRIESFSVSGADLSHYYDAYLSQGKLYFLSQSPDGNFDSSRIHTLEIEGQHQLYTMICSPDPGFGVPCARKQAAIDSVAGSGYILLVGGEVGYDDSASRLVDCWFLDLTTFMWQKIPSEIPIPLIEPRLTATNSGNVYLWGDFDQPLPGMPAGTHLRILKITGFEDIRPPSYEEASKKPTSPPFIPKAPYPAGTVNESSPPYPNIGFVAGNNMQNMAPNQQNNSSYPQNSSYPLSQPFSPPGQQQQSFTESAPHRESDSHQSHYQSSIPQQTYGGNTRQHAYYPTREKRNCCIL